MLAAALLLVCQPAFAEKRVALVLGNSAYRNVAPLSNPVNDGAVIAAKLKEAGFDVVDFRGDLPAAETRRALRDWSATPTSMTRRCRWTACWWRSNPPSSFGW